MSKEQTDLDPAALKAAIATTPFGDYAAEAIGNCIRVYLATSPSPAGGVQAVRAAVLEEAARAVESDPMRHHFPSTIKAAAARVRALSSQAQTTGGVE